MFANDKRNILNVDENGVSDSSGGLFSNYGGTTPPNSSNDSTQGYVVGSTWVDVTTNNAYVCVDNDVGNAKWKLTTLVIDDLASDPLKTWSSQQINSKLESDEIRTDVSGYSDRSGPIIVETGILDQTDTNVDLALQRLHTHTHQADQVPTNTTNFNNILSASDDTVQKALDTLDNFAVNPTTPATAVTTNTTNFNGILNASDTNLQLALDKLDNYTVTPTSTLPATAITTDTTNLTPADTNVQLTLDRLNSAVVAAAGNPFDQSLNTVDNVVFNQVDAPVIQMSQSGANRAQIIMSKLNDGEISNITFYTQAGVGFEWEIRSQPGGVFEIWHPTTGPSLRINRATNATTIFGPLTATLNTDTTNFNGVLSPADNTVQKALDTLDNVVIPSRIVAQIKVNEYERYYTTGTAQYAWLIQDNYLNIFRAYGTIPAELPEMSTLSLSQHGGAATDIRVMKFNKTGVYRLEVIVNIKRADGITGETFDLAFMHFDSAGNIIGPFSHHSKILMTTTVINVKLFEFVQVTSGQYVTPYFLTSSSVYMSQGNAIFAAELVA